MGPRPRVGFIFLHSFTRLFLLIGFLEGYIERLFPRPVHIIGSSAGTIPAAFLGAKDSWNSRRLEELKTKLLAIKPENIFGYDILLESILLLIVATFLFNFIPEDVFKNKKLRFLFRGFKAGGSLSGLFALLYYSTKLMSAPLSSRPLKKLLDLNLNMQDIFQSNTLVEVMTTRLENGQPYFIANRSDIVGSRDSFKWFKQAMIGSMAIAGEFSPVKLNGIEVFDGAYTSLPIRRILKKCNLVVVPFFYNVDLGILNTTKHHPVYEIISRALEITVESRHQQELRQFEDNPRVILCMAEEPIRKVSFHDFEDRRYLLSLIKKGREVFEQNEARINMAMGDFQ